MTVKTLRNILNPTCKRFDERDAIQFLKDPSISRYDKLEAVFGKHWVRIETAEINRLLEDPEKFIDNWLKINRYPIGF